MKRTYEYFEVTIDEMGKNRPQDKEEELFNIIVKRFKAIQEAVDFLEERYGKLPKRLRTEMLLCSDAEPDKNIGFIKRYWNKDISHNSKSWFQIDAITIEKVEEVREYIPPQTFIKKAAA